MDIIFLENGKIALSKDRRIQSVLPIAFFHRHPRIEEAVLITSTPAINELEGISISNLIVNKKQMDVDDFLEYAAEQKGGAGAGQNTQEVIVQNIYKQYAAIKDYEGVISFITDLDNHSKNEEKDGGKMQKIEYRYVADGLTISINLNYKYKKDNPNSIDYIEMTRNHVVNSKVSNGLGISGINKMIKKYSYDPVVSISYISRADLGNLYRAEYDAITTYEDMFKFITEHKSNVGGEKFQNGKLVEKEYYCQFHSFAIRVTLRTYYKASKPNLISHILMFGNVAKVVKPTKVFRYDNTGKEIGVYYTGVVSSPLEAYDPLA
ncbi:hypothetical protein [Tenacibaculum maritimum]|uniref:hypothetical protein n=1 Tax=Tenacibaculum maritimum TaxID=107401 RepID=UPI0012E50EB0|nr:hypothetical protein [Tenacibaculum maritimum]CAA0215031.1 hypothetical protein TMP139_360062 [Tenacibaculum maritimum]CAA0250585.1 hypothetical protein TMP445_760103 [Tenacibaculum maritimum]